MVAGAALAATSACASLPEAPPSGESPLLYDPVAIAAAERIVIALPGVLASVSLYAPLEAWTADGIAVARYRFAGLDGLALDHRVTVDGAIAATQRFLAAYPDKKVGLIGFSAGGQIALEIAAAIPERRPRVVVLAGATGFPDTLAVAARGVWRIARLAISHGAFNPESIWKLQFPILLYGETGARDPACAPKIAAVFDPETTRLITPKDGMLAAHGADIGWRRPPSGAALRDTPILFLHGERDPVVSLAAAEALAARFAQAELRIVPGHGHVLWLTAPDVFDVARAFFLEAPLPQLERPACERFGERVSSTQRSP